MQCLSYLVGILISHFLGKFLLKKLFKVGIAYSFSDILLDRFNFSNDGLEKFIFGGNFDNSSFLKRDIKDKMYRIFFSKAMFVILFLSIFSFFKVVKSYILKFTKFVRKMPVIGFLDGFLGAVCGVLKAFIFLFIFAVICYVIVILTRDELKFLNSNIINSTYLFFLFYKIIYFLK